MVRILVIGGTTASGKSSLALDLAGRTGAWIVNADAQQLYRHLPLLSAQPDAFERQRAKHELYGILEPDEESSAGLWLERLEAVLARAAEEGRPVILVGGTGLYIRCLREGIAPVPPIPPEIRARLRALPLSGRALHDELRQRDPEMAERLHPQDRQRILRALEVLEATGRSLLAYQREAPPRRVRTADLRGISLLPERSRLEPRIRGRLEAMLAAGALAELAELRRERPDLPRLPIARLHGCREFLACLEGRSTRQEAFERTVVATRQYAKRQRTFFRNQFADFSVHGTADEVGESQRAALAHWLRAGWHSVDPFGCGR